MSKKGDQSSSSLKASQYFYDWNSLYAREIPAL